MVSNFFNNLSSLLEVTSRRFNQFEQRFGGGPTQSATVNNGQESRLVGNAGRDFIRQDVTTGFANIRAGAGDDLLFQTVNGTGTNGNGLLSTLGEDGNDVLLGSVFRGRGILEGGQGNDRVEFLGMDLTTESSVAGDEGDDVLIVRNVASPGGGGSSRLNAGGGIGNDTIFASANNAGGIISGGDGNDRIILDGRISNRANFQVMGGSGTDVLELQGTGWFEDRAEGRANGADTAYKRADGTLVLVSGVEQVEFASTPLPSVVPPAPPPPPPPPFVNTFRNTEAGNFVDGLYRTILERDADAGGREFFLNGVLSGRPRADIVKDFFNSQEYRNRNESPESSVRKLFQTLLGRDADSNGLAHFSNILRSGGTFNQVIDEIASSGEARNRASGLFVDSLYGTALERAPDAAGRQTFFNALNNGSITRRDTTKVFFNSPEYTSRNEPAGRTVQKLYQAILNRNADESGLNNLTNFLTRGGTINQVIDFLFDSEEYRNRIGVA